MFDVSKLSVYCTEEERTEDVWVERENAVVVAVGGVTVDDGTEENVSKVDASVDGRDDVWRLVEGTVSVFGMVTIEEDGMGSVVVFAEAGTVVSFVSIIVVGGGHTVGIGIE